MKRLILILLLMQIFVPIASAKELSVEIVPNEMISTCNTRLEAGDLVEFKAAKDVYSNSKIILKKGQIITGTITSLEDNDILKKPASIFIEDFRTEVSGGKNLNLKGVVLKKGNEHEYLPDFSIIPIFNFVRGGEVFINPEKDRFILYFEEL